MSETTLLIGASGSGKSTSIRNLDPKSTFIINVLGKPLPFKGYKSKYTQMKGWDDKEGNYYATDDWQRILKCINLVDKERPEVKVLIIDDGQYIMANEFLRRAKETGYTKFVELAQHMWNIINSLCNTRDDLYSFVLSHNEIDVNGHSKCKTIGKMLDEKITLEGMFTVCLHSMIVNNEYKFLTQSDGVHLAKSPMSMFSDKLIDNDLVYVIEQMKKYSEI